MNWTSSLLGLQFASSGLCAAISVLAPTYFAGFRLPMQFHHNDSFPDPAVELPDTAPSKVPSGDPEQWAPEDSDDAASAASTTRDITSLLLGLLFGPWSTRRRRTSRRTGSLYRHIQTAPTCSLEHLVSSDTAPLLPWPRSRAKAAVPRSK